MRCAMLVFSVLLLYIVQFIVGESVWYISTNGSNDILTCGRSIATPCSSLQLILNNVTVSIPDVNGDCYEPFEDGGITFYLLNGDHFIPPTCFHSWSDTGIIGIGEEVNVQLQLGRHLGNIEFHNSSNITIANINFVSSIVGKAIIYVTETTELYISNCVLPVYATGSYGIWLVDMYGENTITDTLFYGTTSSRTLPLALLISQGKGQNAIFLADRTPPSTFNMTVLNCSFEKLIVNVNEDNPGQFTDDYVDASTNGLAVLVQFRHLAYENNIHFQNCVFRNIINPYGSGVIIRYSDGAGNNTALFTGCTFDNNLSRYGGGVATYFMYNSDMNKLLVSNCSFTQNKATFEGGGVFVVSIVTEPTNKVSIRHCTFLSNSALYGAGVFILNDPNWSNFNTILHATSLRLMSVEMCNCTFTKCAASISEGVVNVLSTFMTLKDEQ